MTVEIELFKNRLHNYKYSAKISFNGGVVAECVDKEINKGFLFQALGNYVFAQKLIKGSMCFGSKKSKKWHVF